MKISFRLSILSLGGTERVFLSVANHLSAVHGHEIDFVVDKLTGSNTENIAIESGFNVISLGAERTWRSIMPMTRYLNRAKPDVLISAYTETNGAALISCLLSRHRPLKVITEHASLDEHWANKPILKRIMLECVVRYLYKLADHVLCVSAGMAAQMRERLNHRHINHIHNPIRFAARTHSKSNARALLNFAENETLLIAVGRISKQKDFLTLLKAFAYLEDLQNCKLLIIGGVVEAAEKKLLDAYISERSLAERVRFVEFTSDLHLYYEAADLLVLSSAWEGFGNVLVEALAFGLNVVSTNCNHGPSEILENGKYGRLVPVGDYVALAKAISSALDSPQFSNELLIARASDFSEFRVGEAYQELIASSIRCKK
jgi:glycosyltransferase involved in cell wall biosynthesis